MLEGTSPAPMDLDSDQSLGRDQNGTDTDNNGVDFRVILASPGIRNTTRITLTAEVVINEIAYDPVGDLSGNGTVSNTLDEFIEIYNSGSTSVDISGWSLWENNQSRFTFPGGTSISPYEFISVFRDTDPNLPGQIFGGATFTLNNTGDLVELRNESNEVVDSADDGGSTDNESWEREPDGVGPFIRASSSFHNSSTLFTPNSDNDGLLRASVVNWEIQ